MLWFFLFYWEGDPDSCILEARRNFSLYLWLVEVKKIRRHDATTHTKQFAFFAISLYLPCFLWVRMFFSAGAVCVVLVDTWQIRIDSACFYKAYNSILPPLQAHALASASPAARRLKYAGGAILYSDLITEGIPCGFSSVK